MNKTILITGATGFIGKYLIQALQSRGDSIIALTTNADAAKRKLTGVEKIVSINEYLSLAKEKFDAIINLAGINLSSKRWNEKFKQKILSSRVDTLNKIAELISNMKQKPEVLISSSGVDIYGDTGDAEIYEDAPAADDFMGSLCTAWEKGAEQSAVYGVRVVVLRTGFVMAKDAVAVKKLTMPYKFFVGGPVGSGRQYMSWIHINDLIGIYLFALDNKSVSGTYNATAPNPEPMKVYCRHMAAAMHRPSIFPVPSFVVKIAVGEMSQVVLYGRKALPKKIMELGYKFKFEKAVDAWREVLAS